MGVPEHALPSAAKMFEAVILGEIKGPGRQRLLRRGEMPDARQWRTEAPFPRSLKGGGFGAGRQRKEQFIILTILDGVAEGGLAVRRAAGLIGM